MPNPKYIVVDITYGKKHTEKVSKMYIIVITDFLYFATFIADPSKLCSVVSVAMDFPLVSTNTLVNLNVGHHYDKIT